jgi:hypothetical protein
MMDMETYEKRAIPRLALIDKLSERCAFDKYEFQCSEAELRARATWKKLMNEQGADEIAAGL